MNSLNIFEYRCFSDFLGDHMRARKADDPSYSYEVLRRRTGIRSASALIMVARGHRLPTPALLHRLLDALALPHRQREYAEAMVGLERADDEKGRLFYELRLKGLRPDPKITNVDLETFDLIGNWYYFPILEMTNLPDFRADPEWIAARLGNRIYPQTARIALERLERLGLIKLRGDFFVERTSNGVRTPDNIPAESLRNFHDGMLSRAKEALLTQGVDERFFTGVTVTFDPKRLTQAGDLINEFMHKFIALMEDKPGKEVYQINVQFFNLTDGKSDKPLEVRRA